MGHQGKTVRHAPRKPRRKVARRAGPGTWSRAGRFFSWLLMMVLGWFHPATAQQAAKRRQQPPPPPPPAAGAQGTATGPWPGQGDPEVEKFRKRIMWRESGNNYRIADPSRRWFGAYQFAMSASNTAAKRMKRPDLVGKPANQWTPEEQDAAFYVMYDRGKGKRYWRVGKKK